jgi:hypothetical protein
MTRVKPIIFNIVLKNGDIIKSKSGMKIPLGYINGRVVR